MIRLIKFLYLRRVLLVFLFFQTISFILLKNNSPYYSAYYFTSSNEFSAKTLDIKTTIISYFDLAKENEKLREENAKLQTKNFNSFSSFKYPKLSFKNDYTIQQSRIINNSIYFTKNYLTIDVGENEKVKPGMGVIGESGIIGVVKSTSDNYATVTSLLHTKLRVSVNIGKNRELASIVWNGDNYRNCEILHLPKHVKISKGDSIFTSGYGGIFPEEILVAIISEVNTEKDKSFHFINAELINNFQALRNAYVVIDRKETEKEVLQKTIEENE